MESLRVSSASFIVYIDRSDIHPGSLEALKAGVIHLVDEIDRLEPQLIAYGFHVDEEAERMTVTAVHPDSASLELHLDVGREKFRGLADLLTLREIEVYGPVSERARAMLEQKAEMLGGARIVAVSTHAGFARTFSSRR